MKIIKGMLDAMKRAMGKGKEIIKKVDEASYKRNDELKAMHEKPKAMPTPSVMKVGKRIIKY